MKIQKPQISKLNDLIVYNIGRLYVLLDSYLYKAYKQFELNPANFNLLMVIKHVGQETGISQNKIGSQLFVSAANITKLIDGLEEKGWLIRIPSKDDRRVKLIKITEEGSALLDKVWAEHAKALNNILGGFSHTDKERFNELLKNFRKEMEVKIIDDE
jgi:MarR family 2-MHQ and catechol resistance regulon transcriptional repressor